MKQTKKKRYEAPRQTVVEFRTELGFATSDDGNGVTATRTGYGDNDGQGEGGEGNNNQSWF